MFRIVGIGEILWDVFPDGPRFGGAPANFACSCAALAKKTAQISMVSGVGNDPLASKALNCLQAFEVDTSAVQVNSHVTGQVNVDLDSTGVATYRFAEDTAWDHLHWNDGLSQLAGQCDAVCFGSLGQRSQISRKVIQQFVASSRPSALRIFDINLRDPYHTEEVIAESLALANVFKLNDDELQRMAELSGLGGSEIEVMAQLADKYQLRFVALTRGPTGAVIWSQDGVSDQPGQAVQVVDTVGAGDSFTAAMTLGLLHGNNLQTVNQNAIATASYVCSQPGATMQLPDALSPKPGA